MRGNLNSIKGGCVPDRILPLIGRKVLPVLVAGMFCLQAGAQRYITKNGYIRFYSETPVETIEAENQQVNAALDTQTGNIVFKVLMKSFEFRKALMQEHFNENYVESDKYPNATFTGKIINLDEIDFTRSGTQDATVEGDLTIHGVTKNITEKGSFTVEEGDINGNAVFSLEVADYEISIPLAVRNNIARQVEVTVKIILKPLN